MPIRFLSTRNAGDDGWHVDVRFGADASDLIQWRATVKSRGRAVLMLILLSDVGRKDASTRLRKGSHAIILGSYFHIVKR